MNVVEQYDTNNLYYPMNVENCKSLSGISFGTANDAIYKTKLDYGDGSSVNATTITATKTYPDYFTGKIKIYNNRLKVININLNIGTSGGTADPGYLDSKNIELTPAILDYFPNTERFYFNHYAHNMSNANLKGKVTGEWASKCGNKLKSLQLVNCDYPDSNATFELSLIPSDSVLETLYLGFASINTSNKIVVNGNLANLPHTCKIVNLGGDKTGTTNKVSGIIPSWVEEFSRLGRNNISGNITDLSPNLRYLRVDGDNEISGILPSFPFLTYLVLTGNNNVKGYLNGVNKAITILSITGMNEVSGTIPNFIECTNLTITGNNFLSGEVPVLAKINSFNLGGNNTIGGHLNLPNAGSVTVGGQNTISSLNLPKSTGIIISGQNTVHGDLFTQISSNTANIQILGQNTISRISGIFSSATQVNIIGQNSLTEDVLSKFPNASNIQIGGNNTMVYATKTFPSSMSNIDITGKAALTTAMVDQLFIDLNTYVTTWTGSKRITVKGYSQPPSSASASARANLLNKSVQIITN